MKKHTKYFATLFFIILIFTLSLYLGNYTVNASEEEKNESSVQTEANYSSIYELEGKKIGVQTGTTFDVQVLAALPNAEICYFTATSDLIAALQANKIEAFAGDEPVLKLMANENPALFVLPENIVEFDLGAIFAKTEKGDSLRKEFNEWLEQYKKDGKLEELTKIWVEGSENDKQLRDYESFPAENGQLIMATEGANPPFTYFRGDKIVGLEVAIAIEFCNSKGYGLKIINMDFDALIPYIQSGKADFSIASLSITEERKESVNFSDPYYVAGTKLAVLKKEKNEASFFERIADSFYKTFVKEDRWKLFVEGILTTLLITILSIIFGTILGFSVFMACRNGNRVTNGISRFCTWIVQGMPLVVLLMVLYYIIFASVAINGKIIAIIAFTLTFGSAVLGMLKTGVGAIDKGQYEAAYALGYSNTRTFFRIILPQTLPIVMPSYKAEIVGLIKATAVVGYVAVQDLTKMGDIVRSRTYEAFFPLIAITVIYFVIEILIGFAVSKLEININPKRRKRESILKGVKTDD